MTSPWRKVVRDLWQEPDSPGGAGDRNRNRRLSALLSAYAILTRELDKGFLETNPASATLHTDAVDDALVSAVLSRPTGEPCGGATDRRRPDRNRAGEWRDLMIFVVKDYGRPPGQQICAGAGSVASGHRRNTDREGRLSGRAREYRR